MLVLIRHPRVALPPGICYGRLDVPLAPDADLAGIIGQLPALPEFQLWSSPAARCMCVAAAIGTAYGVQCRTDNRLLELDFGAWEGLAWSQIPRAEFDKWMASPNDFAPPRGESGASLIARVAAFHLDVTRLAGPHVIVTHGGPLRLLAALACGRPIDLLTASPALGSVQIVAAPASDPAIA